VNWNGTTATIAMAAALLITIAEKIHAFAPILNLICPAISARAIADGCLVLFAKQNQRRNYMAETKNIQSKKIKR